MVIQFNAYSTMDLMGILVALPLAVNFYIRYFLMRHRRPELLFANMLAIMGGICVIMMLQDNVAKAGQPTATMTSGAQTTLRLYRWMYAVTFVTLPASLHFILRYTQRDGVFLRRRIKWLYLASVAAIPLIWTPLFFTASLVPAARMSSWRCAVPFAPQPGPLLTVFAVLWLLTMGYEQYLLWNARAAASAYDERSTLGLRLVQYGWSIWTLAGSFDLAAGAVGWGGIASTPPALCFTAALLTVAIVRDRLRADRFEHELQLAQRVQQALIPKCLPRVEGLDCAGWIRPATTGSGDAYDLWRLPDGRLGALLADASGHGIAPALVVSQTRTLVRALAAEERDPAVIMARVNARLSEDLEAGMFVTAFLAFIGTDGSVNWFSAGHGPILVKLDPDRTTHELEPPAPPLGVIPEWPPEAYGPCQLEPGGLLAICSDGIFEAFNPDREQFDVGRVTAVLDESRGQAVWDLISELTRRVDEWQQGREASDDQTIVLIKRR